MKLFSLLRNDNYFLRHNNQHVFAINHGNRFEKGEFGLKQIQNIQKALK